MTVGCWIRPCKASKKKYSAPCGAGMHASNQGDSMASPIKGGGGKGRKTKQKGEPVSRATWVPCQEPHAFT